MKSSCKESNKNGKSTRIKQKLRVKKMYLGLILHLMKIYHQGISQFHITTADIAITEITISQTKMTMGLEVKVATLQIIFIETIKLVDIIIRKISKGNIKMDTTRLVIRIPTSSSIRIMEVGMVEKVMGTTGVMAMGVASTSTIIPVEDTTIITKATTIIMGKVVSKKNSNMDKDIKLTGTSLGTT